MAIDLLMCGFIVSVFEDRRLVHVSKGIQDTGNGKRLDFHFVTIKA